MSLLTWTEIRDAIARDAGVIIPIGATEQHGYHLPISTDCILPVELAHSVAPHLDFLVAPPIIYGCRSRPLSGGGQSFPGTISLSARTFMSVLEDVLCEFIRHGFRRIVLLNWHYENTHFTYEAATVAYEQARINNVRIMVHDTPGGDPKPETMDALFHGEFPGWGAEHAAIYETSVMLHLRPELVLMDRAVDDCAPIRPPYDLVPPPESFIAPSGTLWKATRASAAVGKLVWDEMVTTVIDEIATGLSPTRS
ncbi:creatininase [Rhodococcus qingshengii]|uniref:creatininase n=1 Tax=Rhodococcus qingshengii TaxID=334542 RepID=UPI0036D8C4E9